MEGGASGREWCPLSNRQLGTWFDGFSGGWCGKVVLLEVIGILRCRCCRGHGFWKTVLLAGNGVNIQIGWSLWIRWPSEGWCGMMVILGVAEDGVE